MGIGLVPQGRRLFPSLSVVENLIIAARPGGSGGSWSLDKVYSFFPILKTRSKLKSTLLSGGEQQMLAISRALMTNPKLLLMDEPSEGLAPMMVRKVNDIIGQLKENSLSILLVEQNLPMALCVADYVYIISRGIIVYESTPDKLKKDEKIKNNYLGVSSER
jgi:branched-chain amino acid transport system ATP-binding protein